MGKSADADSEQDVFADELGRAFKLRTVACGSSITGPSEAKLAVENPNMAKMLSAKIDTEIPFIIVPPRCEPAVQVGSLVMTS